MNAVVACRSVRTGYFLKASLRLTLPPFIPCVYGDVNGRLAAIPRQGINFPWLSFSLSPRPSLETNL